MKILIAPDSFKGSLSSMEAVEIIKRAIRKHFTKAELKAIPMADGGEGTVEAIVEACAGTYKTVEIKDPLFRPVSAKYGLINDGQTAILEMAQASGIMLLKEDEHNPLIASTFGTGQLIKEVLNEGIKDIIIGIGGSATNDGGVGAARALGAEFLDIQGESIAHGGRGLKDLDTIDISALDPRLKDCSIKVLCHVTNPLTGKEGATFVYGAQKGAREWELCKLEAGMKRYREKLKELTGQDIGARAGAGAAGGLGAALIAFCGADLKPGIDTILDIIDFEELIKDIDLVITGEGKLDGQSIYGKVPIGIAKQSKKLDIPVLAIVGGMGKGVQNVYEYGIDSIMVTIDRAMGLSEAIDRADKLLYDSVDRAMRIISIGMHIKESRL